MEIQGEEGHILYSKERELRGNQPCQHLALRLAASIRAGTDVFVVQAPHLGVHYSSPTYLVQ